MSIGTRKLIIAGVIIVVLLMANTGTIVGWMQRIGLITLAELLRAEYATGTAIAVIAALLILLVSPKSSGRTVGLVRRCPVCDHILLMRGTCCSECGSKAA